MIYINLHIMQGAENAHTANIVQVVPSTVRAHHPSQRNGGMATESEAKSLYERLDGYDAITAAVDIIVEWPAIIGGLRRNIVKLPS